VLNRKDPIAAITKLVERCNHSSRIFFIASQMTTTPGFQQLALDWCQNLSQFEFELRNELRRLGGLEPRPATFESMPRDPATSARDCINSVEALVGQYEETLTATLSAHARAMIYRQIEVVRKCYEDLVRIDRAA
jgi:hypothetical protein